MSRTGQGTGQCPDRFWGYIFVFSCGTVTCPCATRCTSIYKTFHIRCSRRVRGQQGQWTGPWFVYIDVLTSIEMTPALSSRFFTSLGFLNHNSSGRCSGKRFDSSMYVIVVMRVNSPCRFLLFVDTSIVCTPLESSLAFTCLWFLTPTVLEDAAAKIRFIDEGDSIGASEFTVLIFW